MQSQNLSIGFAVLLAIFAVTTLLTATPASAQTEKVLFNFATPWQPLAGVIFDAAGNLYGTTYQGGSDANCILQFGCGVVFELSPTGEGGWEGKILHTFSFNGTDGVSPNAGLTLDHAGNLYGTTSQGGV